MPWFRLTGSNPTLPSNYTLYTGDVYLLCPGNEQICAINAANDGNDKPVISSSLCYEMIIALHSQSPTTNVLMKVRPV